VVLTLLRNPIFYFCEKESFKLKASIFFDVFSDDKAEISDSIEMVILLFRNKNRIRVKKQTRRVFQ
jgi:hypothetical protein